MPAGSALTLSPLHTASLAAQGFPDHFLFSGNVHNRHRQVGNAVPPPLAAALGRRLKTVLEEKRRKDVEAALAAQLGF